MNYGAFDDRDHARHRVKLWMGEALPGDYTVANLMGLAKKIVADDLEPVDDIRVQWAETSYGLMRGIVEFAADQLGAERMPGDGAGPVADGAHARARALARDAAAFLPYRTGQARRCLTEALEHLHQSGDGHGAPVHLQRARNAISLALIMLGKPSGRSVAA